MVNTECTYAKVRLINKSLLRVHAQHIPQSRTRRTDFTRNPGTAFRRIRILRFQPVTLFHMPFFLLAPVCDNLNLADHHGKDFSSKERSQFSAEIDHPADCSLLSRGHRHSSVQFQPCQTLTPSDLACVTAGTGHQRCGIRTEAQKPPA